MKKLLAGLVALVALGCAASDPISAARKGGGSTAPKFSINDVTVSENGQVAELTITKSGQARSSSTLNVRTANREAISGSDYSGIDQTVSFSKSTSVVKVYINITDDQTHEGIETFVVNMSAGSNATIVDGQGVVTITDDDDPAATTKTCPDGTVVPIADDCPATPSEPTPNWDQTVTLDGAADIATTDFSIAAAYTTGNPIPPSSGSDVVGAFRFICGAGKIGYIDPIVNPGGNAAHLHQFYGNDSVTKDSTYNSLRAAGGSTCNSFGDGATYAANRSAYWMPAMLVGSDKVLKPDYVSIYYKRRPASDPKCGGLGSVFGAEGTCINVPNGIKFIFGYDMVSGLSPTGALWFNCQGVGAVSGKFLTIAAAMAGCPQGAQLGAVIEAPNCWDGKNLDSPNHRDHVAYGYYDGNTGQYRCPDTHPYVIPAFTLGAWYTVTSEAKAAANAGTLRLSSDDMVTGAAPGTTFHADFFMAWDPVVKAKWHNGCINLKLNCSAGEMGDGSQLKGAAVPSYGWRNPSPIVDKPAAP